MMMRRNRLKNGILNGVVWPSRCIHFKKQSGGAGAGLYAHLHNMDGHENLQLIARRSAIY